ncbi:MAG: SH3 domain-containing protein, partial [Chloroflexi bacterium]|nr:SH3 domain-containing protein [Chloroflexota bacterium]
TVIITGDPDALPIDETFADTVAPTDLGDLESTPAPVTEGDASDASELFVTARTATNVRNGPGTNFAVIGGLRDGDTADIVGRVADNDWLLITRDDDERGWVAFFVVNVTGDPANAPVVAEDILLSDPDAASADAPEDAPETLTAEGVVVTAGVDVVTLTNANLREAPTFSAAVITVVPFDTALQAVARTDNSSWIRVIFEDTSGWLTTGLVNVNVGDDLAALPVEP